MSVTKTFRKVSKVGNSLVLTIPVEYVQSHGLKHGDPVELIANEWLHVRPLPILRETADELQKKAEAAKDILNGDEQ